MPDISFITVTMNSMSTIKALFESFFKYVPESLSWEYYVVDNCSTDGTAEYIAENFPSVRLLKNDSIKGFAENNNIAISKASGGIIALINPDIEFIVFIQKDEAYKLNRCFYDCSKIIKRKTQVECK